MCFTFGFINNVKQKDNVFLFPVKRKEETGFCFYFWILMEYIIR